MSTARRVVRAIVDGPAVKNDYTDRIRNLPDYEKRLKAAGDRAEYELGDRSWAGVILGAFLYPDQDGAHLAEELAV